MPKSTWTAEAHDRFGHVITDRDVDTYEEALAWAATLFPGCDRDENEQDVEIGGVAAVVIRSRSSIRSRGEA